MAAVASAGTHRRHFDLRARGVDSWHSDCFTICSFSSHRLHLARTSATRKARGVFDCAGSDHYVRHRRSVCLVHHDPVGDPIFGELYSDVFQVQWTAEKYVPFVLSLTLWVGVSFEMPLVFMFLGWLGVVNPKMLLKGWRFAIVGCAVIAAIITPTVDPFNMALVMAH